MSIVCVSSGHGLNVRGAEGVLDEVDEARKVVDHVTKLIWGRKISVATFHDDESTTQDENLKRICDWHNSYERDLDISVHFNAYEPTKEPRGTEVWYVTQKDLAAELSAAIAEAGQFKDRGAKYTDDLYFLNHTTEPAVLIEVCFVDSQADAELYRKHFDAICAAIVTVIAETAVA